MIGLNAHRFARRLSVDVRIPVTVATNPGSPAKCWKRQRRSEARWRGGLLQVAQRVVEAAQESGDEMEDRFIKVHQRRANLIEGGDTSGPDAAHAPEVGHLFTEA